MNVITIALILSTVTLSVAGCSGRDSGTDGPPAKPVALVETQPALRQTLRETLRVYGTTEFSTAEAVTVAVQVESQVSQLLVTVGDEVKRGQALLRLVPSPLTQLDLGKARRDADLALAERERMARLRRAGLATESDLLTAANAAATAVAMRDSLGARVGPAALLTVRASRDGIVDLLTVQPGEVLTPGAVVLRIAAPDALQVRLGIEPQDANRVAAGQAVHLAPLMPGAVTVTAVVSSTDHRIDPLTRLTAALVHLPPGSGLLPGAVLRAEIEVAQHLDAVTAPRSALLYAGEQAYLFVADGDHARRREIKTGVQDGEMVEIAAGLAAGEALIIAGNAVLEDGMLIRSQAEAAPLHTRASDERVQQ